MKSNLHEKMNLQPPKAKIKVETLPRDYIGRKDPQKASLRVLKRASPYNSSFLDAYTGKTQNAEAINKEGQRHRQHRATIQKKVGTVAYPREIPSKKYKHHFLNERLRGYGDLERANIRNAVTDCIAAERSEQNDSDSDSCSVGSCSVNNDIENMFSNCHKENCCHCLEEKVGITIHSLEMHAYRCTLEALYASGPLSWEQEELLTNLRIMLHISNDEHLTELRNLIPSGNSR